MSDDFTTIPRLFYWRNYDYWLRLFQKLLRLFQPERYDYCSPLLAIGRKPEKSCGGSRQWFRAARRAPAAGLPRRVEGARLTRCTLTADRCQDSSRRADRVQVETLTPQQVRRVCTADSVSALVSDLQTAGADPAGLAWSAVYCTVWHGSITGAPLHPYIPYYNRAAVLTCTTSGVALVSGTGGGAALDGMPSSVAQVVYRQFVRLLYCARWNGSN